jgi:hypothetical protein
MIKFEDFFFKETPFIDVVPGKFHGDENTPNRIKKFDPRPMFKRHTDKHGYRPHGEYYDKETSEILTNDTYQGGVVDCSNGRPSFKTSDEKVIHPNDIKASIRGSKNYRTNLIRPVLYSWLEKPTGLMDNAFLVTIEGGSSHVYCMKLEMINSVKLARHIRKSKDPRTGKVSYKEPSLRPMTYGNIHLGRVVGKIVLKSSGKEHPLYDTIIIR